MKVVQANKFFYVRGGAERYFLDLVDLLPEMQVDVAPFSMQDSQNRNSAYTRYFVPGVDYRRARAPWSAAATALRTVYHREARRRAGRLADAFQPDVAHLHNIHHQLTGAVLDAFRDRGIPVIQTLHDYQWVCPVYTFLSHGRVCEACRGRRFHQAVRRRCQDGSVLRSAVAALELWLGYQKGWTDSISVFLAPSRFLGEKMVEHGIPAHKVRQMNYSLNLGRYRSGSAERGNHVLYAGRLSKEKGVHTLVEALGLAPGVELRIAGSGPLESELKTLAETRAPGRVRFMGHLEPEDLHREIAGARVVVVPSEWYENQPFAVLESFALSTPVLGAAIGGIPELVRPGETGWLFPPGDALALSRALITAREDGKARELGAAARRWVERDFDPREHVERLVEVYREVAV